MKKEIIISNSTMTSCLQYFIVVKYTKIYLKNGQMM